MLWRGTVSKQKKVENSTVTLFSEGYCFGAKKVENSTPLKKGTVLVPLGHFFLNNHVYETVPFGHWGTEIVALRVLYYGQSNSARRGIVLVPFFSEWAFTPVPSCSSHPGVNGRCHTELQC